MLARGLTLNVVLVYTCALFCSSTAYAREDVIAVFQFTANSMSVVGLENEVAYEVRNELSKRTSIALISKREMEVELARNDIAQTFDSDEAILAGQALNADFVLIGKVSRLNGTIITNLEMISTAMQSSIQTWAFQFDNQKAIAQHAPSIVNKLVEVIELHHEQHDAESGQAQSDWLDSLSATYAGENATIVWKQTLAAPAALGFNIYRSEQENGPFGYLTSVFENQYIDDLKNKQGHMFYQIALLTEDGEELRASQKAKVTVAEQNESDIASPIVVSHNALLRGMEFQLIPSSQNTGKAILGYHLLRREIGQVWQIVDHYSFSKDSQKSSSATTEVLQISLSDKQNQSLLAAPVQYALRAFGDDVFGKRSQVFDYQPVIAPTIEPHEPLMFRQVRLSWSPSKYGEGYHIYRKSPEQQQWKKLTSLTGIHTSQYVDTNFSQDSQAFDYALTVYDKYNETAIGPITQLKSKLPFSAPQGIQGHSGLARKITINWQPIDDPELTGYVVYRGDYSDAIKVTLQELDRVLQRGMTEYTDENSLKDNTRYLYAVAAINSYGGIGALTPAITVATKTPPADSEPEQIVAQLINDGLYEYKIEIVKFSLP